MQGLSFIRTTFHLFAFSAMVILLAQHRPARAQVYGPQLVDPIRVPTNMEALQALESSLSEELQGLDTEPQMGPYPEGEEPPQRELDRTKAARELCDTLKNYVGQLREIRGLRTQLGDGDSDDISRKLGEELVALGQRVQEIEARIPERPRTITDEEMTEAKQELDAAQADWTARSDMQKTRRDRIDTASARAEAAGKSAQDAAAQLLVALADYETQRAAASEDVDRAVADLLLRRAQIVASNPLADQVIIELEAQRDARLVAHAEQRLPFDRDVLNALQKRYDKLREFQTKSDAEMVQAMVRWLKMEPDASEYQLAFWQLRLAMIEALAEINGMLDQAKIRDRFPREEYDELLDELVSRRLTWEGFAKSLHRRPKEQIRDRYEQINRMVPFWEAEHEQKRKLADLSFDERATILARLDELADGVRDQRRKIRDIQRKNPTDEHVVKLAPQLAEYEDQFDKQLVSIEDNLNSLVERLDDATAKIDAHVVELAQLRNKIYIAYLGVQDRQFWKYRWSESVKEWNDKKRTEIRAREWEDAKRVFGSLTRGEWALMGLLVAGTCGVAVWSRRRLFDHAARLEAKVAARAQASESSVAPMSDRFHLQATEFLAITAVHLWPMLAIWGCARFVLPDSQVAHFVLAMYVSAVLLRGLIRVLFTQTKPRFRLLPCSNVTARYYRRWLNAMYLVTLIVFPPIVLLYAASGSQYSSGYALTLFKLIILAMFLVFASRKQTVLKIVGRPEDVRYPWLFSLVSLFYPIAYLGFILLFVGVVLGYGALTNYFMAGLLRTTVTVFLAWLGWRYLRDRAGEAWRSLREVADSTEPAEQPTSGQEPESKPIATKDKKPALSRSDEDLWFGLGISLVRWAVVIGVAIITLEYWGLTLVDLRGLMDVTLVSASADRPAIAVQQAIVAMIVVAASYLLARTIRRAIQLKVGQSLATEDRGGWIAIGTLAQYVILLFGLYFGLYAMRIPLGALTVVLGTVGLGLGLGLQPLFANFFSGLVILFERHVKVGDIVALDDGTTGEVTSISIRATTIRTPDNIDIVIPNGEFISGKVINWTLNDTQIRAKLNIGVVYGSDPRVVEKLLLQVAYESPLILADPPPEVRFMEFGDNSLNFTLFAWCRNAADRWNFLTQSRYRVLELFAKAGIEIPFPQRTITTSEDKPLKIEILNAPRPTDRPDRDSLKPQKSRLPG